MADQTGDVSRIRKREDAFGTRAEFDEIEIGQELEPCEWVVTAEDIDKQCVIDEDYHAWYSLDSPWGGRIAPPQIQYRPPRWMLTRTYNVRGVLYKWAFETFKVIKPGEKMTLTGKIINTWVQNEREFITFEVVGRDTAGEKVFVTQRTHVLDVIERTAPRHGAGIDSGHKPETI